MKIVLDTNVFISGVFWSGPPRNVLYLWAQEKIGIITSPLILDEYLRVLRKINRESKIAETWMNFVIENGLIVKDKVVVNICRDPHDNKFLNAAIIGAADFLVSGDEDLLSLKSINSIKIVTPVSFLKLYK